MAIKTRAYADAVERDKRSCSSLSLMEMLAEKGCITFGSMPVVEFYVDYNPEPDIIIPGRIDDEPLHGIKTSN